MHSLKSIFALWVIICATSVKLWAADRDSSFAFTKVDTALLDQIEILNQKFDKDGLEYHEEALVRYVSQVGQSMLPAGGAPERRCAGAPDRRVRQSLVCR